MLKNIVIFTLLIVITWQGYALYQFNSNSSHTGADGDTTVSDKNNVEPTPAIVGEVSKAQIPYCLMGLCPRFESMDITQGQTQSYTVIIQPTHMTKGTGEVWVVDGEPKEVFRSKVYAQVGVVPSPEHNGFYITYVTGENNNLKRTDRVIYENGKFMVIENVNLP